MGDEVLFDLNGVPVFHHVADGGEGGAHGVHLTKGINVHLDVGRTALVVYAPTGVDRALVKRLLGQVPEGWWRRLGAVAPTVPETEVEGLMTSIRRVGFPQLAWHARHLTGYHPLMVPRRAIGEVPREGGWIRGIAPLVRTDPWDEEIAHLVLFLAQTMKPVVDDETDAILKCVTTLLRLPEDDHATYPADMDVHSKFRLLLFLGLCGIEVAVPGFDQVDLGDPALDDGEDALLVCHVLAGLHPDSVPPLRLYQ